MPLETLITGRIATLSGDKGFGWVEAIGIRDGRIAFAGSEVDLETRADPFTERIRLEPDQVAIPGLTDAHLHLAQAAIAARQVDLTDAADARGGAGAARRRPRGAAARRLAARATAGTPTGGAPGRPPTSWRPWRRAAARRSGRTTTTPCWRATRRWRPAELGDRRRSARRRRPPRRRRRRRRASCTRRRPALVTVHVPPLDPRRPRARPSSRSGRSSCRSGSSPATIPAAVAPDPGPRRTRSRPTRGCPRRGRLPMRVHACAARRRAARRPSSAACAAARPLGARPRRAGPRSAG